MIKKKPFTYAINPLFLFLKTLGVVFLAEFLVMFFISLLPEISVPLEAFIDALILSVIVVPALYFLLFRPIQETLAEKARVESERLELEKMEKVKNEFISIAAHELGTPVATIMGYAELLSDPNMVNSLDEEQKKDCLSEINTNSERLAKIIDDILDVSRIESGHRLPLHKESLSITALTEKVLYRFRLKSDRNITLESRPEVPETLEFDKHRIEQVTENLLSNAIKYSPSESPITIVVEADDRCCRVTVTDQGIGMSNEQKARVYDKFYRADSSDTAVSGFGLGMSIVKQIIDDHDGTISIESKLGLGTSVCFTLPR